MNAVDPPLPRAARGFSALVIAVFFVAITVNAAFMFDLLWPSSSFVSLLVISGVTIYYLINPLGQLDFDIMFAGLAIVGFLIFEHFVFVYKAHAPLNFNAIVAYLPLVSFVPLSRNKVPLSAKLYIFAIVTTVYLFLYVGLNGFLLSGNFDDPHVIHQGDATRDVHLYLAAGSASFVAFYALKAVNLAWLLRMTMLGISAVAIWLSNARTFQILFVLIFVLAALRLTGLGARLVLFACFLAASCVILAGLVFEDFNPFAVTSADSSGYARAVEYTYAVRAIKSHWLLGVGIPGNFSTLQTYLKTPRYDPLYVTDLAVIGPFVTFGLAGVLAYFAVSWICIVGPAQGFRKPDFHALHLNCILCGVNGIISPSLLLEQNSIFLALIVVAWVDQRRAGRTLIGTTYRADEMKPSDNPVTTIS